MPSRVASGAARALVGAGALGCALAAALLAPWYAPRGGAGRAVHAVLCDVSPSVVRTRPRWREWLTAELEREAALAAAGDLELVALAYGRERRFLEPRGSSWRAALDALDVDGTARAGDAAASDLWTALESLEARLGERALAGLTWLAPGDATGRDPAARLARLAARAGGLERRAPPPAELVDLALVELELPRAVAPGAALQARLWVAGSGDVGARLEVRLETPAGPLEWSQRLEPADFAPEPRPLELALGPAQSGATGIELRLTADGGGDAVPENDRLHALVRAGDDVSVALLADVGELATARALALALSAARGIAARVVAPDELARALAQDDVVVHLGPALEALPARALETFLALGGGWLLCTGDVAPSRAAWSSPAARLAPLDLAPESGEERDVLLLVDRSGSMGAAGADGAPSALDEGRAAALRLVEALPERARLTLFTFAAGLDPALDVAADPAAALAPLSAGGATDVAAALDALALRRVDAPRPALALVVSDGRDQPRDADLLSALRERLRAVQVELEVLAVGADADLEYLRALAGDARRLRVVARTRDLAEALARAANGARERREGPYAVAFASPRGALSRAALDVEVFAPRAAHLAARARPGAERALVAGEAREDLLALARHGRGAVAALAARARPEDALWLASLLRWLGSGRSEAGARLEWRGSDLVVGDVPDDWPVSVVARRADGGAGEALLLPPAEAVVDPRDRRVGTWTAERPADGLFVLAAAAPQGRPLALLAAHGPAAPEFALPPRMVPVAAEVGVRAAPSTPPERGAHPLGRPLLLVGLALVAAGGLLLGRAPAGDPVAGGTRR